MRGKYCLFKRKEAKVWYFYYYEGDKRIFRSTGEELKTEAESYAESYVSGEGKMDEERSTAWCETMVSILNQMTNPDVFNNSFLLGQYFDAATTGLEFIVGKSSVEKAIRDLRDEPNELESVDEDKTLLEFPELSIHGPN